METAYQSQPLATVVNENRKALFSFIGVFLSQQNFSRRKSRKNAYFSSQMCIFANSKSERSLAIQNNVPQYTPLISKSLPIHLSLNGNTLFFNKIVHKQKISTDLLRERLCTLYRFYNSPLSALIEKAIASFLQK